MKKHLFHQVTSRLIADLTTPLLLTLGLPAAFAGDGVGYNGPILDGPSIPSEIDIGLSGREMARAQARCLLGTGPNEWGFLRKTLAQVNGGTPTFTPNDESITLNLISSLGNDGFAGRKRYLRLQARARLGVGEFMLGQNDDADASLLYLSSDPASPSFYLIEIPKLAMISEIGLELGPTAGSRVAERDLFHRVFVGNVIQGFAVIKDMENLRLPSGEYSTCLLYHLADPEAEAEPRETPPSNLNPIEFADDLPLSCQISRDRELNTALGNLFESRRNLGRGMTRTARSEWLESDTQLMFQAMQIVRDLYSSGNFTGSDHQTLRECLASLPDGRSIEQLLSRIIIDETYIDLHEASTGSNRDALNTLVPRPYIMMERPIARLDQFASGPKNAASHLSAGTHRGRGSIQTDFTAIPSHELHFILFHETAHALDEELMRSIALFKDPIQLQRIQHLLAALPPEDARPDRFPQSLSEVLTPWLLAGLNRGLWAEYRAWRATFALYRSGVQARMGRPPIAWFEEVLTAIQQAQETPEGRELSWETHLYRYLDSHSKDPEDGIFAHPLVRQELTRLRTKARNSPHPPHPGDYLGRFRD